MGTRVLIIDDDASLLKILTDDLVDRGCIVEQARTGVEGLGKFISWKPSLVLLDLLLPKMDGFKVCRAIKDTEQGKATPVVIMSGVYKSDPTRKETIEFLHAHAFLPKPLDFSLLHATLSPLLGTDHTPAPDDRPAPSPRALMGDLSDTPVPGLLMSVLKDQKTGCLDLTTGTVTRRIYFIYGYPVYVELGPTADNLGRILLQMGRISRDDYEKALRVVSATRKGLGLVLLEEKFFTAPQLNALMRIQIMEKLVNCFFYRSGSYSFTDRDDFVDDIIIYKTHPGEVILNGIRKFYSLQEIDAEIGPLMSEPVYLARGASDFIKGLRLYKHERDFLSLVRSGTSPLDVVSQGNLGLTETLKILYSLIAMRVLTFSEEEGGEEAFSLDAEWRDASGENDDRRKDVLAKRILEDYFRLKTLNYFEMLGVDESSPREVIEESFVDHMEFYTPEMISRLGSSEVRDRARELLSKLQTAYEILMDDSRRVAYVREVARTRTEGTKVLKIRSEFSLIEGRDLLRENRGEEAEFKFREALRFYPDSAEATAWLGWTLYRMGRNPEGAVALIRKALIMDERQKEALYFLGRVYKEEGALEKAVACFARALQMDPMYTEAEEEFKEIQRPL